MGRAHNQGKVETIMAEGIRVDSKLWQEFVARHHVGIMDQEAFLDYLTHLEAPSLETMPALEKVYQRFLRQGPLPVDIH
jgi:hypothetical protein